MAGNDNSGRVASPEVTAPPRSGLVSWRLEFLVCGVLLPLVCIGASILGIPTSTDELWQSGETAVYAALLLRLPCLAVQLPLTFLSMSCLAIWVYDPAMSRYLVVRGGIYTGGLIAAYFFALTLCASLLLPLIGAVPLAIAMGISRLLMPTSHGVPRFTIRGLLVLTVAGAIVCFYLRRSGSVVGVMQLIALTIVTGATPLCLMAFLAATAQVESRNREAPLQWARWLGFWIAWMTGLTIEWYLTMRFLSDEYAKLPTTNPSADCYLTHAARYRYTWTKWGRDRDLAFHEGVSWQTRRLKFLENVIAHAFPSFHRRLRHYYDRFGPPLAFRCARSPFLATLTYVAFVPWEILAIVSLRLLQIRFRETDRAPIIFQRPVGQTMVAARDTSQEANFE